jgi:hypothetical protein
MKIPWWKWLPWQHWRSLGVVDSADDVPELLPSNGLVLVGSHGLLKWVAFDCPCRRDHRILLNVDPGRRPFWQLTKDGAGRLSVSPSVDARNGQRRCHYFIRDGRILWAKDSDR